MIERFVDSFELLLYLYLGPDSCSQSSCIKTSFRVQRYKPPVINGRLQSLDKQIRLLVLEHPEQHHDSALILTQPVQVFC